MHDLNRLRHERVRYEAGLRKRGCSADLDALIAVDDRRRALLAEENTLRHRRRNTSLDATETRKLADVVSARRSAEAELHRHLLALPNLPDDSVPPGHSADDDVCLRDVRSPLALPESPRPHWEIAEALGMLDRTSATRVAGRGFAVWTGAGAGLRRALGNFALDLHVGEHGYREVAVPQVVTRAAAEATGQLSRMRGGMYALEGGERFLSPKTEVALTGLDAGRTFAPADLPIRRVALAECFRRHAGAPGKRDRAAARFRQFATVELLSLVGPGAGQDELERMLGHVEAVPRRLGLRHRVMEHCAGRLSFAACKVYRVEVWAPGSQQWLVAGTAAWSADFQSRRAGIRLRLPGSKSTYLHTVNATATGLERTLAAVLETHLQADGTVSVPDSLKPYMPTSLNAPRLRV